MLHAQKAVAVVLGVQLTGRGCSVHTRSCGHTSTMIPTAFSANVWSKSHVHLYTCAGEDTAFAPLIPDLLRLLEGKGQLQVSRVSLLQRPSPMLTCGGSRHDCRWAYPFLSHAFSCERLCTLCVSRLVLELSTVVHTPPALQGIMLHQPVAPQHKPADYVQPVTLQTPGFYQTLDYN